MAIYDCKRTRSGSRPHFCGPAHREVKMWSLRFSVTVARGIPAPVEGIRLLKS